MARIGPGGGDDRVVRASKKSFQGRVTLGIIVALGACFVGISIGLVGIGGVFLIPLLVLAGHPQEEAIGTSLVVFTVTGAIATVIYAARSAIDWRSAAFTTIGSVAGGPLGAKLSVWLPEIAVSAAFAGFLIFTGVATLLRRRAIPTQARADITIGWAGLVACGLGVGVGSGLTGVGGPAILVPLLLLLDVPSSAAIGISQPNAIAASASGAFGHLLFGRIDWPLAGFLCIVAGFGVVFGALSHGRFSGETMRKVVAATCIALGLWLSGQLIRRLGT